MGVTAQTTAAAGGGTPLLPGSCRKQGRCYRVNLKNYLRTELDLPVSSGTRDVAERAVPDSRIRITPLRRVRQAERFAAQFQLHPLTDSELFKDGSVQIPESRSADRVTSKVSDLQSSGLREAIRSHAG